MSSSSKPGEALNYFHGVAEGYRIGLRLGVAFGIGLAMYAVWLWSAVAKVIN